MPRTTATWDRFADDVRGADWSEFAWEIGPVTNYDISWGVHGETDVVGIPDFLINAEIVSEWSDVGLLLLVQITGENTYEVAGRGLDTR